MSDNKDKTDMSEVLRELCGYPNPYSNSLEEIEQLEKLVAKNES